MSPSTSHPSDETLTSLAEGDLFGRPREKLLEHLRECETCGARHERLVELSRLLAGGQRHEPTDEELSALRQANRAAVLASARTAPEAEVKLLAGWFSRLMPLAVAASVLLVGGIGLLVVSQQRAPVDAGSGGEFSARGADRVDPGGTLRVFCMDAATPRRLEEGDTCPTGATLAFAVRFTAPPGSLRIEVTGGAVPEAHPLEPALEPGRESVLPFTLTLEGEGEREVTVHGGPRPLSQRIIVGGRP